MTGRLVFEGTSEIPSKLSTVRVTLTALAASPRTRSVTAASAKADGTIEITNLLPGAYRVGVELPDDIADRWWPRSASTAGRDLLDVPLELAAGASPDVVFTLSDRRPSLSGTVQDADARPAADATIVVFSTDRTSWPRASRRVRTARPATDGHYEIRDLPPGEYFVAAIRRMQPDAAQHPDLLERIAAEAVRVVVGEGEQKALNVRVR